jgi:hypothetical protein
LKLVRSRRGSGVEFYLSPDNWSNPDWVNGGSV